MKRNTITLIVALVLGLSTFWLISRSGKGTINPELRDFAVSDTASISKIFLVSKSEKQVTLTREADGRWKVNGKYYARPDAIKTLLITIHALSVREPVGLKAKENIIKQLNRKLLQTGGDGNEENLYNFLKLWFCAYRFRPFSCSRYPGRNGKCPLWITGVKKIPDDWLKFTLKNSNS